MSGVIVNNGSAAAHASSDFSIRGHLSSFVDRVQTIAKGLCRALTRANTEAPPVFGKRYKAMAETGQDGSVAIQDRHAGYRVLGDKAKGVEPGFIALLDWADADSERVMQPDDELHAHAQQALLENPIFDGIHGDAAASLGGLLRKTLYDTVDESTHPVLKDFTDNMLGMIDNSKLPSHIDMLLRGFSAIDEQAAKAFATNIIKNAFAPGGHADHIAGKDALAGALKDFVMSKAAKFNEKHYIKLDYYEADRFNGKYQIPKDKAVGGFWLVRALHRLFTGETAAERNKGAVREVLANDLMRLLGVESQELSLIEGKYENAVPKLMLDGKHVDGFRDFNGDPKKGDIYIKDGVFVRNTQKNPGIGAPYDGRPVLDRSLDALGRNKILMLLLSDRDALGSKGANKGYVGSRFVGIDPGHALEKNLLKRRNDIRSDFSFEQPSSLSSKCYKNFSVFDQSSFAEKMEGVRQIKALAEQGDDMQLFDVYAQRFGDKSKKELYFAKDIQEMQKLYMQRRDAILAVFSERLEVDTFNFGADISDDVKTTRRDTALNLLDCLEKLTSKTIGKTAGGIALAYPQVETPSDRREWSVRQNPDNSLEFSFTGSKSAAKQVQKRFEAYRTGEAAFAPASRLSGDGKSVSFTVPLDRLSDIAQAFDYSALMRYKHA